MNLSLRGLFISFLEGTISSSDERVLIQWLRNNPESIVECKDFCKIWLLTDLVRSMESETLELQWGRLLQKVIKSKNSSQNLGKIFINRLARIAAVFILGALFSFGFTYYHNKDKIRDLKFTGMLENDPVGQTIEAIGIAA